MATTKLTNLLNPQVVGEYIDAKLVDKIKLSPLAIVGTELQGRPGNTLTVPTWQYVGEAIDLAEGVADVPVVLESDSETVTVKKAAKSVEITDEAVLSGHGNPVGEIADQLLLSIADKVEKDCYTALGGATLKHTAAVTAEAIADAIGLFGEDLDEEMRVFINPKEYATIRKGAEFVAAANVQGAIGGSIGYIYNAAVVVSNRVPQGQAYIVKAGALGIELKRNTNVESDRDILKKTTVYAVDKHYAAYLRDKTKVVKIANA
jgi:N4-gp56 family major capsid protein